MVMTASERDWIRKLVKSQQQAQQEELEKLRSQKNVTNRGSDKPTPGIDNVPDGGSKSIEQILDKHLVDTGHASGSPSDPDAEKKRQERKEEHLMDVLDRVEEGINTQRIQEKVSPTLSRETKTQAERGNAAARRSVATQVARFEEVETAILLEYDVQLQGKLGKTRDLLTDQDWVDHGAKIHQAMAKAVEKVALAKNLTSHGEAYLAHFASRHGPRTTKDEQSTRLVTGVPPDKKDGRVDIGAKSINLTPTETASVKKYTAEGNDGARNASRVSSGQAALYLLEDAISQASEAAQHGFSEDFTVDVKKEDYSDDGFGENYSIPDTANVPSVTNAVASLNLPASNPQHGKKFDQRADAIRKIANIKTAKVVMVQTPDGGFAPKTMTTDTAISATGSRMIYGDRDAPSVVNMATVMGNEKTKIKDDATQLRNAATQKTNEAKLALKNKEAALQNKTQAVNQQVALHAEAEAELKTMVNAVDDLHAAKAGQDRIDQAKKAVVDIAGRILALGNQISQKKLDVPNPAASPADKKLAQMDLQRAEAQLKTVKAAKEELEKHLASETMVKLIEAVDKELKEAQKALDEARTAAKSKLAGANDQAKDGILTQLKGAAEQQTLARQAAQQAAIEIQKAQAYEAYAKNALEDIDPSPATLQGVKEQLALELANAKATGNLEVVAKKQKGEIDSYKALVEEEALERAQKLAEVDQDADGQLKLAAEAKLRLEAAKKVVEDAKALPDAKKKALQGAQEHSAKLKKALPELQKQKEQLEGSLQNLMLKASQFKGLYEALEKTPSDAVQNLSKQARFAEVEAQKLEKKASGADQESQRLGVKQKEAEQRLNEVRTLLESAKRAVAKLQEGPGPQVQDRFRLAEERDRQAKEAAAQTRQLMDDVAEDQGTANRAQQEREPILQQFHDRQAADKVVHEAMQQLDKASGEADIAKAKELVAKAQEDAGKWPGLDQLRDRLTVVNKKLRDAEQQAQGKAELLENQLKASARLSQEAQDVQIAAREASQQEEAEAEEAARKIEEEARKIQRLVESTTQDIEKQLQIAKQAREAAAVKTNEAESVRQDAEQKRAKELESARLAMEKRAEDAKQSAQALEQTTRELDEKTQQFESAKSEVAEAQKAFDQARKNSVETIKQAEEKVKISKAEADPAADAAAKADQLRTRLKEEAHADGAAEDAELARAYAEHELRVATAEVAVGDQKTVLKAKVAELKVRHLTAVAELAQAQAEVTRAKHEVPEIEKALLDLQKKAVEVDGNLLKVNAKITAITNKVESARSKQEKIDLEQHQKEQGRLMAAKARIQARQNVDIVDSQAHRKKAQALVANKDLKPLKEAVRVAKEAYEQEAAKL